MEINTKEPKFPLRNLGFAREFDMKHMVTDLKLKLVSINLSLWKFFYCLQCKTEKKILQQSIEKKNQGSKSRT